MFKLTSLCSLLLFLFSTTLSASLDLTFTRVSGVVGLTNSGPIFASSIQDILGSFDNVNGGYALTPPVPRPLVNNLGQVAGRDSGGTFIQNPDGTKHYVSVPAGVVLAGINDNQQLTGYVTNRSMCSTQLAPCGIIIEPDGRVTTFNGLFETFAYDINNAGQVVGATHNDESGFIRDADGRIRRVLAGQGAASANALYGINNRGDAVGVFYNESFADPINGRPAPFFGAYIASGGSLELVKYPGAFSTFLYDINDRGQIFGHAIGPDLNVDFIATPVPEPDSALMVATFLACLGWCRIRRSDGLVGLCARR